LIQHRLDPLAADLADRIARVAGGAAAHGHFPDHAALSDRAVGDMRRHLAGAQDLDEGGHVISLVGAQCDAALAQAAAEHGERRLPLGGAGRARQRRVDGEERVRYPVKRRPRVL